MAASTNQHPASGDRSSPEWALPEPDEIFDAGSLGCGDGPLTRIATTLKQMAPGDVLEIRSTNPGVSADLPVWCRMVGHSYLGSDRNRYFVQRKDG